MAQLIKSYMSDMAFSHFWDIFKRSKKIAATYTKEISELKEKLKETQAILEEQQHHDGNKIHRISESLKHSRDECLIMEKDQQAYEFRIRQADEKRRDMEREVHDLQRHIFSIQPLPPVILGPEAGREFASFCGVVEEWVQTNLGDALDDRAILKVGFNSHSAAAILSLISPPGKIAFQIPSTDEYNVIAAIMQFLCLEIFDKEFYCPMGELKLVADLQEILQTLQPRRGMS